MCSDVRGMKSINELVIYPFNINENSRPLSSLVSYPFKTIDYSMMPINYCIVRNKLIAFRIISVSISTIDKLLTMIRPLPFYQPIKHLSRNPSVGKYGRYQLQYNPG